MKVKDLMAQLALFNFNTEVCIVHTGCSDCNGEFLQEAESLIIKPTSDWANDDIPVCLDGKQYYLEIKGA